MTLNILPIAMNATACLGCNKSFDFYKFIGSEIDDMGRDIPQYEEPITLTGSIQPISNKMYEQFGLDLNQNYMSIFSAALIQSIAENQQPDKIVYNNQTYEVVENKDWYLTNGWTKVLVVEIKSERQNAGTNNNI